MLGIDERLERRLAPAAVPRRVDRGRVIAIAGLDGSGKSCHAARLVTNCRKLGLASQSVKLYRQGPFLELADELAARTRTGGRLSNFRLSRIVKLIDSLRVLRDAILPGLANGELLVMDRYLETHRAAASSQLCWDLGTHPILACFPAAERTIWLDVPMDRALSRLATRSRAFSADEHETGLVGYANAYARWAGELGWQRLDACAPFSVNARAIDEALGLDHVHGDFSEPPAPAKRGPANAATRTRLLVGGRCERMLGQDIFGLRRLVDSRLGSVAAGIPESFWIEAYALDAALELRSQPERSAAIAVWPAALARMPLLGDLDTLFEVSRLIEATAEVVSFSAQGAEAWFDELCPHPIARGRLLDDYLAALRLCARERGWALDHDTKAPLRWRRNRSRPEVVR